MEPLLLPVQSDETVSVSLQLEHTPASPESAAQTDYIPKQIFKSATPPSILATWLWWGLQVI